MTTRAFVPVPEGRARWRLTLHERAFSVNRRLDDLFIAEITHARSIQVQQTLNAPSTLGFSLSGLDAAAPLIREFMTDVVAWRWDELTARDWPVMRGIVAQSQDTLSEQADTVTFNCHSYLAMLERRVITYPRSFAQADQDDIAGALVEYGAKNVSTTDQTVSFQPGSYLPLAVLLVDPDGRQRFVKSGKLRDRSYVGQELVSEMLDNLANVLDGFCYDVVPGTQYTEAWPDDQLRIFFPTQGMPRDDVVLEYGSSVSALSRSVNSANYGNFVRLIGDRSNPDDSESPPLVSEVWNPDSNDITRAPVGLWMTGDNASDVKDQGTLDEKSAGNLATTGLLIPSYSVDLRPGWYLWGSPNMGDTARLIIRKGRLNVDEAVQVVGISYDVGDDGGETVKLDLGRPVVTFGDLLTSASRDVNALARR